MKNIVLVGFMGTGKTMVAKKLSSELGKKYVSMDDVIVQKDGRSINEIFEKEGEKYFRQIEKQVVKELCSKSDQIIDAGGGAILDAENLKDLKSNGLVICLWASVNEIYERTKKHSHRPLLNVPDPVGKIRELLEFRKPFYEKADFHIDTTDFDLDTVVKRVKEIAGEEKS